MYKQIKSEKEWHFSVDAVPPSCLGAIQAETGHEICNEPVSSVSARPKARSNNK